MSDPEFVGFEPGPHHRCDQCRCTFQQTPWAFPLMNLGYPEALRFCTEDCLDAYAAEHKSVAGKP